MEDYLKNALTLNHYECDIHGEYAKFKNEQEQGCPHCLSEAAKKAELETVQKLNFGMSQLIRKVPINCQLHKDVVLEVPALMASNDLECPYCIKDKRESKLGPALKALCKREIERAGIPKNHISQKFSKIDLMKSPKQQAIAQRLIQYVRDSVKQGDFIGAKNILFSGNMGTGKTLFASILMQEVIRRSMAANVHDELDIALKGTLAVQFVSEATLKDEITATWTKGSPDSVKKMISRYSTKGLLCIDDVGLVSSGHTHLLDFYANLIDERYKQCLPTIITSNLTKDDLIHAIGARSVDRFFEKNRIIVANFDWSGYRTAEAGTDEIEMF